MYAPHLPKHTLAVVGLIQPWGAVMPIAEAQARYHCELLLKRVSLPDEEQMKREIGEYREKMRARYGDSPRHTVQVIFWWENLKVKWLDMCLFRMQILFSIWNVKYSSELYERFHIQIILYRNSIRNFYHSLFNTLKFK